MFDFIDESPIITSLILSVVVGLFTALYCCSHIRFGEEVYTGYIYSAEDGLNTTTGHIRFAENAGEDSQPPFCVARRDGDTIKQYVGTGKKVRVVQPAGFVVAAPWDCAYPVAIEEVEK